MIILLVIIGLALLILGHEAGHFFFAKFFGVKVDEFGFGFPPRVFGARRYKGKVAVPVEEDTQTSIEIEEGGPPNELGEASVIVEKITEQTREIDILETKKTWRFFWRQEKPEESLDGLKGGTIYSINLLPFGGFVRIPGENDLFDDVNRNSEDGGTPTVASERKSNLLTSQPVWKRSLIVLAGVIANFFIGWLVISAVFMVGVPPKVVVMDIEKGSPAETAGFKADDIVVNYDKSQDLINFINANKGKEISIDVLRGPNTLVLKVVPRKTVEAGKGAVGVYLNDSGIPKESFFSSIGSGLKEAWNILKDTTVAFGAVIKSIFINRTVPQDVVGPVGIVSFAATAGRLGIVYFLQLLAIISLNLAVINLIPFPALDGGRFLFLLIEKIKGSPIPRSLEAWVNGVGFALLLLLMAVVTVRDIGRL